MTVTRSEFVHLDGARVEERILEIGGTGLVIQREVFALKIPRLTHDFGSDGEVLRDKSSPPQAGDYDLRADRINSIEDEQPIYDRLGSHDRIVCCYSRTPSQSSIKMKLMQNSDLRH